MKNSMHKLALALGVFLMAGGAMAANVIASSGGKVIAPIGIANTVGLEFGNLSAGNGTVIVSTDSKRTNPGGNGLAQFGSTEGIKAAVFHVTGEGAQTFAITSTNSALTLGSNTMPLALIIKSVAGVDATAPVATSGVDGTGVLSAGAATIFVGGSLTVGATQAVGTYVGTVSVTVEYN